MQVKEWLGQNTVYITLAGSRAYGLSIPESDWDYRGCTVPPLDYYFGLLKFEQSDSKETINYVLHLMDGWKTKDADISIWSLQKMISLAADGNPNMIELMFIPEDMIVYQHPIMKRFFDIKESFLSKLLKHRFSGYAMQQLKRIRNHKRWMDNPPQKPTREQFGIEGINFPKDQMQACDKLIEYQVDQWIVDKTDLPEDVKIQLGPQVVKMINVVLEQLQIETRIEGIKDVLERAANRHLGFDSDFIVYLQKFKAFRSAQAEYKEYQKWLKERNPKRAELERKFGYDTKHGHTLVRLMHMCREALEKGEINIDRRGIDAEELLRIRYEGLWSYEKIESFAVEEDEALEELMEKSSLPKSPNRKLINEILTESIYEHLSLKENSSIIRECRNIGLTFLNEEQKKESQIIPMPQSLVDYYNEPKPECPTKKGYSVEDDW